MLADPKKTKDDVVQWIRNYFAENGKDCTAVVGISGGKDSSIVAALCVEALGKDRVIGVLMPNGEQTDIDDAVKICEVLGIKFTQIDIQEAYRGILDSMNHMYVPRDDGSHISDSMVVSEQAKINLPPRLRMATLYAVAQSIPGGGRVANTCNLSEDFVGYSTKFGDSAGDFSPLANLMVHEVIQIGHELPIPADLVDKIPADGLCGKTDEDNLGVSYSEIDSYIETGTCGIAEHGHRIEDLHRKNLHKVNPMPAFNIYSVQS